MPADTIAHRVGDFVFVNDVDLVNGDPGLWIVILAVDPAQNIGAGAATELQCGQVDGSVVTVPRGTLGASLQTQNTLRAASGLPPLPDPTPIAHGSPARPLGAGDP